jgi:hypothetical protein
VRLYGVALAVAVTCVVGAFVGMVTSVLFLSVLRILDDEVTATLRATRTGEPIEPKVFLELVKRVFLLGTVVGASWGGSGVARVMVSDRLIQIFGLVSFGIVLVVTVFPWFVNVIIHHVYWNRRRD